MPGQAWRKGYENMKQISTGAGLLGLGVCMVATAFIATHRSGGEAFAQVTGGERRIVYTNLMNANGVICAYRIWSDNSIDWRGIGSYSIQGVRCNDPVYPNAFETVNVFRWAAPGYVSGYCPSLDLGVGWKTIDNGTSGFRPLTDVDMSGETDAGDISQVLLDFNTRADDVPPPPIDCTINAPR